MKSEYTISEVTDTDEHNVSDGYNARVSTKLGAFITNHGDQALTARLERSATHDPDMSEAITDTGDVSVAAGETQVIVADDSFPLGYFRVVISYDSAPSSADPSVTVRYQDE